MQVIMMMISLAVGAVLGELLDLEIGWSASAPGSRSRRKASRTAAIGAFVAASLTVCKVGAMAIVGSIQDGILGDHATLFIRPCSTL